MLGMNWRGSSARSLSAAVLSVFLLGVACSKSEPPQPMAENWVSEHVDPDAAFSAVRYENGQVSLNEQCPVRRTKLNTKLQPLFVNGQPIGFC